LGKFYHSDVVEDFHGVKVADPFRWLEDADSEMTIKWSEEQNNRCKDYLAQAPNREEDRKRLTELWDYPKYFVPTKVGEALYYQKNNGLQNQAVFYKLENGTETIVLDPNTFSEDGTIALTNYAFSKNGKYMAYSVSSSGSDWQTISIRNLTTLEDLEEKIQWVKFTSIAWLPDETGFYYSRFPEPGTVPQDEESMYCKVYLHKLGTSQAEDELIFSHPTDNELTFYPVISKDEEFLILNVFRGTATENGIYMKKLYENGEVRFLLNDFDAFYHYVNNEGSTFYFQTNLNAPNGRIISIDINEDARSNWKEVVPEKAHVMDEVTCTNGKLVIAYLEHAHHKLYVYSMEGEELNEISIPIMGSLTSSLSGSKKGSQVFFGITSFLSPTTVYSYDLETKELAVFAESLLTFNPAEYETKQIFYTSKDGTKVPMFITAKKDLNLDGENPTILYGYGGFNINMTPSFSPAILRWMEKGGVYAVANLRGGTEYGENWHRAGMLENKQNVFDDFIAAGEWLIKNHYTKKEKLSIMGGSNGGLLVAACMVQRPDLFGAVICRVPVIDMLRYHKFTVGRFWIPEYGDPSIEEHFKFLYAYSPLHNIKEGVLYPPVLIATAESDDRVVPAHAKKFAATLIENADPQSKVYLRLEAKAGHGFGKPTSKLIEEWVDFYSFLDLELQS